MRFQLKHLRMLVAEMDKLEVDDDTFVICRDPDREVMYADVASIQYSVVDEDPNILITFD